MKLFFKGELTPDFWALKGLIAFSYSLLVNGPSYIAFLGLNKLKSSLFYLTFALKADRII